MSGGTLARTFALLSALALNVACDGVITFRGRVYEQRRPGAQSRAFINRAPDEDLSGLVPLADAKVSLYHGGDQEQGKLEPPTVRKQETRTNSAGEFDASAVTAPYKFRAALVVEKPGYKPVTELFEHGGQPHTAVIILVPDAKP